MKKSVGLRSLAVHFPGVVRTNEYFRRRRPELVAEAERRSLSQVFSPRDTSEQSRLFDEAMVPYLSDPFRGTVHRRVLGPGESALSIEAEAARKALIAADVPPRSVDLTIVHSFLPDQPGLGNAAFLSRELGLGGTSWNLESTCSSIIQALHTACAFVRAGEYERVLVVGSCTYSRVLDESDTLGWFLGDGAGAFVVGSVPQGQGLLGFKSVHTAETCGVFLWDYDVTEAGKPRLCFRPGAKHLNRVLRDTSATVLRACCLGAIEDAGVRLEDIACFVFNTPVAWFHSFAASALGVPVEKTLTHYRDFANIGPVLTTTNLHYAAREKGLRPGDLVLVYAVGSVSSAGAAVMRWGDVRLGPPPPPADDLPQQLFLAKNPGSLVYFEGAKGL